MVMVVSRDLVAGVVLLAASTGYYVMATGIPLSLLDTTVNSSVVPRMLGIGGAGFSLILIAQTLFGQWQQSRALADTEPAAPAAPAPDQWLQHRRALAILIIVTAYMLLLNLLGYIVSMALMLAATAYYQARFYGSVRSPTIMLGLPLVGALLFWAIFDLLLGIPMPAGLWRQLW
jgi:hypothetical protein